MDVSEAYAFGKPNTLMEQLKDKIKGGSIITEQDDLLLYASWVLVAACFFGLCFGLIYLSFTRPWGKTLLGGFYERFHNRSQSD